MGLKPMTKFLIVVCAIIASLFAQVALAGELIIGSDAPKLEVQKFVKGKAVKRFEPGKIYVIELWGTWCGPCRDVIPHVTELQKQYPEVSFIGVALFEEMPDAVAMFVDLTRSDSDNLSFAGLFLSRVRQQNSPFTCLRLIALNKEAKINVIYYFWNYKSRC